MNVRELIERYNGAWNAHDLDAIDALHHRDVVFHNHTADEKAEGADSVREHIAAIFPNNPDLRFSTRSLNVGDDFAVCEWTARAARRRVGRRRRLLNCCRARSARPGTGN